MNIHIIPAEVNNVGKCETCGEAADPVVHRVLFNVEARKLSFEVRMCEGCLRDFNALTVTALGIVSDARNHVTGRRVDLNA